MQLAIDYALKLYELCFLPIHMAMFPDKNDIIIVYGQPTIKARTTIIWLTGELCIVHKT